MPLLQELIKQVAIANPDRHIALVGFSLGATTVRDALRRLWVEWADRTWDVNIFSRVDTVVARVGREPRRRQLREASAALNLTMRGTVTCEMGQRNQYTETDVPPPAQRPADTTTHGEFGGWWETPCADGDYAFGKRGACGGHTVAYTTITMQDLPNGTQQDEFVSEHASRLYPTDCANNLARRPQRLRYQRLLLQRLLPQPLRQRAQRRRPREGHRRAGGN